MERQDFSYIRIVMVIWFFGICGFANAQELVPNGSFNYSDTCSYGTVSPPTELVPWFRHFGSVDFLHPCFPSGYSVPQSAWGGGESFSGEGYTGLINVNTTFLRREFLETELFSSLSQGISYHVEFYVSLMDSAWYASKNIGAYFSENIPP